MNKYLLLFVSFALFLRTSCQAQSGFSIIHNFCPDTILSYAAMCLADDNRFYVAGLTKTDGVSNQHGYIGSFDYLGNHIWSKSLANLPKENAYSTLKGLTKMRDNKILFIGTMVATPSIWYPFIYMFDKNGDSILFKELPSASDIHLFNSVLVDNKHILAAGSVSYNTAPYSNGLWFVKMDTVGNVIWEKEYLSRAGGAAYPYKIVKSNDQLHYVIAGEMYDSVKKDQASCLLKIDTAGNVKWLKQVKKKYFSEHAIDIVVNPSGGYYFISTNSLAKPLSDGSPDSLAIFYGKLNEFGTVVWTKSYTGNFGYCMGSQIEWADADRRELVLLVKSNSGNKTSVMKIDTFGNVEWAKTYHHFYDFSLKDDRPYYDNLASMSVTSNYNYLFAGLTMSDKGYYSWMMMTDKNGCRYTNDPACWPTSIEIPENTSVKIYPNPVNNFLNIEGIKPNTTIICTDVMGRILYRTISNSSNVSISCTNFPAGFFLVSLIDTNGTRSTRTMSKP